jgi:CheY-like chemotaxis protein
LHYRDFNWNGVTFLIADDDHYSHLLLEKVFLKTGAKVIHAYNGKQAVEMAMNHELSLALIDIVMPGLNGYEVVTSIKTLKPDVLCVAYTADAVRVNKKKCQEAGFDHMLIKPLLPVHLFRELCKVFEKAKSYR